MASDVAGLVGSRIDDMLDKVKMGAINPWDASHFRWPDGLPKERGGERNASAALASARKAAGDFGSLRHFGHHPGRNGAAESSHADDGTLMSAETLSSVSLCDRLWFCALIACMPPRDVDGKPDVCFATARSCIVSKTVTQSSPSSGAGEFEN
jgi:hypothetical protein